jgi:hypothetical protein
MEQKDFLLREIEKMGIIINAIRQKMFRNEENPALTFENQIENAEREMLNEINFYLAKF